MSVIPLRAGRAVNSLYKSCQRRSQHGTSAPNDSGIESGGGGTGNEAKGMCKEAQIKGGKGKRSTEKQRPTGKEGVDKSCQTKLTSES